MTSQNQTAETADKHEQDRNAIASRTNEIGGRAPWHVLSPFSSSALEYLPRGTQRPQRYTREDGIPDSADRNHESSAVVRDYNSINSLVQVRVPKKIPTTIKVEGKVWFANERTWISWLNLAILLGTLSLALFNASSETVARDFAYFYAFVSIGILIYGYLLYQRRITMIRKRDPGHYDQILGPVVVSALLFFAILANFIIRVRELERQNVPVPGMSLFFNNATAAA